MTRHFRLGGDVELTNLQREIARRTARSQMRGDDNLHRVEHAGGANIDTRAADAGPSGRARSDAAAFDQRSGPPARHTSPVTLRPAVPAAPHSLVLPWPPSGNHAHFHVDNARVIKPEVARYRRHVAALCYNAGRVAGRYVLHLHLSPPDARARDIDNALKSIGDALVRAGFLPDDSMAFMRELHVTVDDARNGSAIVRVVPLDNHPRAA